MSNLDVYFVRPEDVHDQLLQLQPSESHHLIHVNRGQVRDQFIAVDAKGSAYHCEIGQISDVVTARILRKVDSFGEPRFRLTLAVAVPKKNRLDLIVEKGTEIGVAQFAPILTSRSIAKETSVRVNRLSRIGIAAMKQCRRSVLPPIEQPATFESMCRSAGHYALKLIAHEKQTQTSILDLNSNSQAGLTPNLKGSGILCVGPEGGFSADEIAFAEKCGFNCFGLGQRRLRTETAALVAATIVLATMKEL